jgi:lipoate-protein ligase A
MTIVSAPSKTGWKLVETSPMSGIDNMRWDEDRMAATASGDEDSTIRFFSFAEPTVSYGRLQSEGDISRLTPEGWPAVRRPTAGGVVHHNGDLCISLIWKPGAAPLPERPRHLYGWIHRVIAHAIASFQPVRLASCCDTQKPVVPFNQRQCFQEPVGYDVLADDAKIVGGALCLRRDSCLYQGSIQWTNPQLKDALKAAFRSALGIAA